LSSTEAEYRVLTNVAKDIVYFRRLLKELGIDIDQPTYLLSYNQSCIRLVENPIQHGRIKHIKIQHHFIRETAKNREVQVDYMPTQVQQTNFLIKPLPHKSFINNQRNASIIPPYLTSLKI